MDVRVCDLCGLLRVTTLSGSREKRGPISGSFSGGTRCGMGEIWKGGRLRK